jgi:Tol biopolymer transport system component
MTPLPGTPTHTKEPGTYPDDTEVIAFAAKETGTPQLFLYHFSDGTITALPEIDGGACQPDWSPDGLMLAFISPCIKNQLLYEDAFIYVLTLADGNITKLPLERGSFDPAWSPDGNSILFTLAYSSSQSQIFRLDITDGSIHAMTDDFRMNFDPEWSPDGSQIAFVSNRADVKYVYIMSNVPGSEPVLLTRSEDRQNYNPTWSPGGIIVISQGKVGELESLVWVSLEMLTTDPGFYQEFRVSQDTTVVMEVDPDFNTNGGWLAYESWPDGRNHDIYIMRADGLFVSQLTTLDGIEFDPAWKPVP